MILLQFAFLFSIIFSALMVIFTKNPIHSVLWLIMSFFSGAGIILLLDTEFVAMLFLVVYMGAIAVLFLFVVMMINIKIDQVNSSLVTYLPLGIIVFLIFFMEVWSSISVGVYEENLKNFNWFANAYSTSNIKIVGNILYTYKLPCFIMAGMILLVAMIGSITLTLAEMKGPKTQNIYKQLKQDFKQSVRLKVEKNT